jgi:aryl-alcohol dehydrogenase-like predicted oxidoreductase
MGMSFLYGPTDDAENTRVLHRYLDLGGNFLDTAEVYGPYTNEELLGRFLKEIQRESVVVATKFGFRLENGVAKQSEVSGGGKRSGREKGLFTGSIRSCLGSSARKRYDPDSGHKTGSLPGG